MQGQSPFPLQYVPLKGDAGRVAETLFPGSHSDGGGLYGDNHLMADLALAWVAAGMIAGEGLAGILIAVLTVVL